MGDSQDKEDFQIALRDRLAVVRQRISAAASKAGRQGESIRLLPVSKTVDVDRLRWAVELGCSQLAENRIQEIVRKHDGLADLDVEWVVIGNQQTNKARDIARFAGEFQALDNERLAQALNRRLEAENRSLPVYVQVNTSAEPQKGGVDPEELTGFLHKLHEFPRLDVHGLMTLAIHSADSEQVRQCFSTLRILRDRAIEEVPELIGPGFLSMGMSGDFEIAIEEGSTCVRVGQAIFGPRL